jgi:DNA-directed RNA polymerase II subunit RPB1
MVDTEIYSYEDRVKQIDRVEFTILGNEELKKISALGKDNPGIELPDLYDNLEPKIGGLIDPRLGTSDDNIDCATCGLNNTHCVGHFGHIDMAEPVFHIGYLPFIKKILSCICLACSKLLVYKNEEEIEEMLRTKSGKARQNEIRNLVKNVTYCQKQYYGCGTPVAKIKIEIKKANATINLFAETNLETAMDGAEGGQSFEKKKQKQLLTPDLVYNILSLISDTDCELLGMDPKKSRPEMMVYKVFPVPPVQMRPSARVDFMASSTREDDLTHKLADIVKANMRIRKQKESEIKSEMVSKYTMDHVYLLQYHVATYINNESLQMPKAEQKSKLFKSLNSRLSGKEGRIRYNLMGKRTDFSARTVITSDPTIDINQLGVPVSIAKNLTYPEVVTPHNIDYLTKLVRNGREVYPGANFVFPISNMVPGRRILPIDLRYKKEKVDLRYGDVVERHLQSGDIVLLNRQPTLHKQSMMGHRIKVIDNPALNTFRLSPSVTKPYNADFDGDKSISSPIA